jgi:hypothetical protein
MTEPHLERVGLYCTLCEHLLAMHAGADGRVMTEPRLERVGLYRTLCEHLLAVHAGQCAPQASRAQKKETVEYGNYEAY